MTVLHNFIKNLIPYDLTQKIIFYKNYNKPIFNFKIINYVGADNRTFILAVGPNFDLNYPIAMTVARIGYVNAFKDLNFNVIICDIRDLHNYNLNCNDIVMYYFDDIKYIEKKNVEKISKLKNIIWVQPFFDNQNNFFNKNNLNPDIWKTDSYTLNIIDKLVPKFVFNATVESGLVYFSKWHNFTNKVLSLPLACDTSVYSVPKKFNVNYANIDMCFVGGYWASKGKQIDLYLRKYEDNLAIFGYNKWPYRGYRGFLNSREDESILYKQAKISVVINEPTVSLLGGQINERIFKVFGSYGCPVVDAIPQYRELYSEDELIVPKSVEEFDFYINDLQNDESKNLSIRERGYNATLNRHTYVHRANKILKNID